MAESSNSTKDIMKNVTETPSLGNDKPSPAMVTPSSVCNDGDDTVSQKTSDENVEHHSQPDHLGITKDKPVTKEAWQAPATETAKDEVQPTEDKGTVEDVNVKQVDEDLKVEDVEDEQQEIMEYVAVLEEEEKEGKGEEEEEERY